MNLFLNDMFVVPSTELSTDNESLKMEYKLCTNVYGKGNTMVGVVYGREEAERIADSFNALLFIEDLKKYPAVIRDKEHLQDCFWYHQTQAFRKLFLDTIDGTENYRKLNENLIQEIAVLKKQLCKYEALVEGNVSRAIE